jgi:hypothetical protein
MSRNELIKFVHKTTGLTFKESRKFCKAAAWNEEQIVLFVTGQYIEQIGSFVEIFSELMDAIADVAADIAKEAKEIADFNFKVAAALCNGDNSPVFAPYDAPTDSNDNLPETTQGDAETQQGGK